VDIPDITQFWAAITITLIMSLPKTMHILIAPIIGLSQTSIKIKDIFGTCKPHKRITQKLELENALQNHFSEHFAQAKGTPMTIDPIAQFISHSLNTQVATVFKMGLLKIDQFPNIPSHQCQIFTELQRTKTSPPEIDVHITHRDISDGYKIWKESTLTSPLGRHLSLSKIWVTKKTSTEYLSTEEYFRIFAKIYNTAINIGYPLKRWKIIHNLFTQKEKNNFKIHRLRFLHIIDAELNQIRRDIITRRLLANAERHNFISDNQYGGRQGREAIDIPTLTAWQMDIVYMSRSNIAYTDCDARACYDQIIPEFTALAQYQAGLPEKATQFFLNALKQMEYYMVTGYGPAKTGISSSEQVQYTGRDKVLQMPHRVGH
jgi:hypothetical protein